MVGTHLFVVEISTVKNYLMLLKVYLVAMDRLKCKTVSRKRIFKQNCTNA